ncbi:MAG: hypothetical protein ACLT98_14435 [Eggerthellaceae bacterium]
MAGDGEDDADLLAARRLVEGEDGPACARRFVVHAGGLPRPARAPRPTRSWSARRKLYVASRASEALVVAMDAKAPRRALSGYALLVDDIRSALCATAIFLRALPSFLRRHRAGPLRAHPRTAAGAARRGGRRACARTAVLRARRGRRFAVDAFAEFGARRRFSRGRCRASYGGTAPVRFERNPVQPPEPRAERVELAPEPRLFFVPVVDDAAVDALRGGSARDDAFVLSIAPNPDRLRRARARLRRGRGQGDGSGQLPSLRSWPSRRKCLYAARLGVLSEAYALSTGRARGWSMPASWFSATYAETLQAAARRGAVLRADIRCVRGRRSIFCTDDAHLGARALVVDYKTGGSTASAGSCAPALLQAHATPMHCCGRAASRWSCASRASSARIRRGTCKP